MRPQLLILLGVTVCTLCTSISLYSQETYYNAQGHFSLIIPMGWERVLEEVVEEEMKNRFEETEFEGREPSYDLMFQLSGTEEPAEYPYFLVNYYVVDMNEKTRKEFIDTFSDQYRKILSMKGMDDLYIDSKWKEPSYDEERKLLTFTTESQMLLDDIQTQIVSVTNLVFCRTGIIMIAFYSYSSEFEKYEPIISTVINSVQIDEGYEYGADDMNEQYQTEDSTKMEQTAENIGSLIGLAVVIGIIYLIYKMILDNGNSKSGDESAD